MVLLLMYDLHVQSPGLIPCLGRRGVAGAGIRSSGRGATNPGASVKAGETTTPCGAATAAATETEADATGRGDADEADHAGRETGAASEAARSGSGEPSRTRRRGGDPLPGAEARGAGPRGATSAAEDAVAARCEARDRTNEGDRGPR